MKHPVLRGHPLHAILSDLPATLIPCAFVSSVVADASGRRELDAVAAWTGRAACAASACAGGVGWWDWWTMPSDHAARRPATVHGALNSASLALAGAAALIRRRRSVLLGGATATLLMGAWIGGELVFRHGWRVRPAEEAELVEGRLEEHGQAAVVRSAREEVAAFERSETIMPAG